MRILRNYILKDFLLQFFFSFLSLNMVMLLGNLMKISDMVIRKGVGIFDALRIFLFFMPYLLGFTIPLSFLLGILLMMGRIIADNEMVAMRVAGISVFKIIKIFLMLGAIFSLFLFILSDRIIPDFHYRYRTQIKNIYAKNVSALIEPGTFLEGFQDRIIYVSDVEGNKLKNIFIYETGGKEKRSRVIFAKRGKFIVEEGILKMELEEGFRDEDNPGKKGEFYRLNFKVFFMNIPVVEKKKVHVEKKASDMSLKELLLKIKHLKSIGINPVELTAEFHKRISFSFSVIVFIVLGFGLSLIVRHREKSINLGIAFLAAGVYYLLFILGEAMVDYRVLLPFLGMWLPNLIMLLLGSYLLYRNAHFR